ncbi:MAG: 6-bladed beta-propeller [Sphingobacterium sp.]|jgi:hypothetical protein|nr:6-bladed beta-propeller [Sphingobacterium sp.]
MRSYFGKILLLLLILMVNGVSAEQPAQDTMFLRVDPDDALGGTATDLLKDIVYIPLENTPASVVGEIAKLEVVEKYFIILDKSLDQVLIFNKDGSFHAKCEKIPGLVKNSAMIDNFNYNVFGDFAIQREKQQIVVRTNLDRENLFVFNYDGGFSGKIPLSKKNNGTRFWGYAFLNGDTSIYHISPTIFTQESDETGTYELYLSDNFSSNFKQEIPYEQNNIARGMDVLVNLAGPFYYSGIKNSCFFTRSYDYNIYNIDANGIKSVYKVLLPISYSVPIDFLVNEEKYRSKRQEYLQKNNQLVYVISNIYSLGNKLIFTINNNKYSKNKVFLYNIQNSTVFSLLNISPDSSSFFLPIVNKHNSIQACDGHYLYSSFSSLELFAAKEEIQGKQPEYPPSLKKYFALQNRKSNPVIVKLAPKANM